MQDSGLALIASHSTNHTEFNKLSVEETLENVDSSYKALEENLGEQKTKSSHIHMDYIAKNN